MLVADAVRGSLPSAVTNDPAVIGIVGVIVLIGAGYLVYSRLIAAPGRRFARVLKSVDEAAILMHPNPDPDAMSSALGAKAIAEEVGTETTLYYPGQIRHHENRAFQTVLDVEFQRIESAGEIDEREVILVDHNEPRGFEEAGEIDPVAVVDHHPGDGTGDEFSDIRIEHGACATIFAEYLDQLGKKPIRPDDANGGDQPGTVPPRVATALVHGIQSDTKHLTSGCSAAEFDAAEFLYRGIDEDKLDRIANPEVDVESLEVKARAITDREVDGVFAISDVGEVSNADAIPQAADELRRLEGINAVVVLGDKDDAIQLSGRSTDDRVHMGKVLETAIESVPMAEAGGHARMGGGRIPLDHMEGLAPGEGLTREELKQRLFDAMNGAR